MEEAVDEILGPAKPEESDGGEGNELEMVSQELIDAVKSGNPKDVAQALRTAFECLEAQPHSEGPAESED